MTRTWIQHGQGECPPEAAKAPDGLVAPVVAAAVDSGSGSGFAAAAGYAVAGGVAQRIRESHNDYRNTDERGQSVEDDMEESTAPPLRRKATWWQTCDHLQTRWVWVGGFGGCAVSLFCWYGVGTACLERKSGL